MAVEFALLSVILLTIVLGVIQFGIALSKLEVYVSAAREGARYAAVHCRPEATTCTQPLIAARVTQAANGNPIGGSPDADIDCSISPGQPVTVSWDQQIPVEIPLLPDMTFTMNVAGTFRCE